MKKVLNTKNYRLFHNNTTDNRPLNLKKHKKLIASMKKNGFLECYPIIVFRNDKDQLIVKDGQHRLAIAESLGLTVFYLEVREDFDVAEVNDTQKVWVLDDYALKYAVNGGKAYQEGLEFAEKHDLSPSTAFALLGGTTTFSNLEQQFKAGGYKIKDREWANLVASIYGPIVALSPTIRKNARLLEACMAVSRVPDFDPKRLLMGAERCREKLVSYSTRDAYLDMLETVYNFGRSKLVGLKAAAMMAMRDRNVVKVKGERNGKAKA